MKNTSFLRRKNLAGGLMAATLVTGMAGQTALALTTEQYANLGSALETKAIGEGKFEFTRVDIKNNMIYARAGEGQKIEWIRVAYRKNGEKEMNQGGMVQLVAFSEEVREQIFYDWGYTELGIWTAFQAKGNWEDRFSTYESGYEFDTKEKALIYKGTAKLSEINEKKVYYAVKEWEEGKEGEGEKDCYWVGEIDYSGCFLDECELNREKSTEFQKVFTGGVNPNAGTTGGSGAGTTGSTTPGTTGGTTSGATTGGAGTTPGDSGVTPGMTTGGTVPGATTGSGTTSGTTLPTTNPLDKDSELDLTDKEEDNEEVEFEDESEEGETEETGGKEKTETTIKKSNKTAGTGNTGVYSVFSGALVTSGNAVSRASEADSSDESDETDMDSDLGLDTVYDGSEALETPVLGEGTGQKKGFAGWVWAAIVGLIAMGGVVVAWWFYPAGAKKVKGGQK